MKTLTKDGITLQASHFDDYNNVAIIQRHNANTGEDDSFSFWVPDMYDYFQQTPTTSITQYLNDKVLEYMHATDYINWTLNN